MAIELVRGALLKALDRCEQRGACTGDGEQLATLALTGGQEDKKTIGFRSSLPPVKFTGFCVARFAAETPDRSEQQGAWTGDRGNLRRA